VLTLTLSVLALVFTTLRSWPQFVRIVVKGERRGVSLLTWTLALANHTGWLLFGVLSELPLLVVVNVVAAVGCGATVWVLRSWAMATVVAAGAGSASVTAWSAGEPVLLAAITLSALVMFVPQLIRTLRRPALGVSPVAWAMSALASATWISYAVAIDRPSIVIAHGFMLPASLVILARSVAAPTVDVDLATLPDPSS
jgi:uncharacterized protein with PQ loop repeat